jgi:hypothetical protein
MGYKRKESQRPIVSYRGQEEYFDSVLVMATECKRAQGKNS